MLFTRWLQYLKARWSAPSGYRNVLTFAFPLIITTGIFSIQAFIDRLLLSQYSSDAIAAAVPAGLIAISLTSLFIGLASYVGIFVAQFYGARQFDQVAKIVWQGFYYIFPATLIVIPVWMLLPDLIRWVGHDPILQTMEIDYARILVLAIPLIMLSASLNGFLTGLGKLRLVMWASLVMTLVNLLLDYLLIFGFWGFPAMGIRGAGWATVIALFTVVCIQLAIFLSKQNRKIYQTAKHWRFDSVLFKRLFRFGLPAGLQMQFESLSMMVFVLLVGTIGVLELTAHSIAMNIFMIAVMPMAGMSGAIAVLVGQCLGQGKPELAQKVTVSAMQLAIPVFLFIAALLFLLPELFITPFSKGMTTELSTAISPLIKDLLKAAALYCIFDAIFMLYSGALRGAGDTKFIALVGIGFSWVLLVLPAALIILFVEDKLRWVWVVLVVYMLALAITCHLRFWRGGWKKAVLISDSS